MLKEGVKVGDETMAPEEIVANEIDNYTRLLRIKKVNNLNFAIWSRAKM